MDIKICGLTNSTDAEAALEFGADYLGFVLYPDSPRGITAERLAGIRHDIGFDARMIAVFVNAPRRSVDAIASACHLHAVQIHGDESAEEFSTTPYPVWRAVRAREGQTNPDPSLWPATRYVIDSAPPGVYGGSGETGDWNMAAAMARDYPCMLAGGLTPENVAAAIQTVKPLGVDVSSGIEKEPGLKDHAAMKDFIEQSRKA
jgi:phosphoribosylanthranilate isomerase